MEVFLAKFDAGCGLAFVVVQHLDPDRTSSLVELLGSKCRLPVELIGNGERVEPNHVYVIPPDFDLFVRQGRLQLQKPSEPHGLRLPIDAFFRSLAEDQHRWGLAVVLSGMGSDGALGIRAVKAHGGAVFVQSAESAKFDSMPRHAIDSGVVDVVAAVEDLPAKIRSYLEHVPAPKDRDAHAPELSDEGQRALRRIITLLRAQTGHDFTGYKNSTLLRRIERRIGLHQLKGMTDYAHYLQVNRAEGELLFKELLIGVTSFFRNASLWETLKRETLPDLLARFPDGGKLRAWVPACSTGEEAFSLAIVFQEVLQDLNPPAHYDLQIFATDLDADAIDKARAGVYPTNIAADVSESRLERFFTAEDHRYRVGKEIREMVVFAPHNLTMDPPFTKLDVISCRNVLIYWEAALQRKIFSLFHYSLKPDGILVLGTAETVADTPRLFVVQDGKNRIYQRVQDTERAGDKSAPPAELPQTRGLAPVDPPLPVLQTPNIQTLCDGLLLHRFAPTAVLTTKDGDLIYVRGKTGKYLEPATGKANLNLFAMARPGLAGPLDEAFARARRQPQPVKMTNLQIEGLTSGLVDLHVENLSEPPEMKGMCLVVFHDRPMTANTADRQASGGEAPAAGAENSRQLAEALREARSDLAIARGEMQVSREELQSTNEELQSTNEELQSTNEELTTSKEEMQSINEELQTVNHELQAKLDELSKVSDDMKNLLNSTEIAALFLDEDLQVRRFTVEATRLIKLIPGDAGRPVTDLVSRLDYPKLSADSHEVLRTLVFKESEVSTHDGDCYRVRIMPYRTQRNRIDGVVITFVDITESKQLEAGLRESLTMLQHRFVPAEDQLDATGDLEKIARRYQPLLDRRSAPANKSPTHGKSLPEAGQ